MGRPVVVRPAARLCRASRFFLMRLLRTRRRPITRRTPSPMRRRRARARPREPTHTSRPALSAPDAVVCSIGRRSESFPLHASWAPLAAAARAGRSAVAPPRCHSRRQPSSRPRSGLIHRGLRPHASPRRSCARMAASLTAMRHASLRPRHSSAQPCRTRSASADPPCARRNTSAAALPSPARSLAHSASARRASCSSRSAPRGNCCV